MSGELAYPEQPTYWVARDSAGNVILAGVTQPSQITTTGQDVLATGTRAEQVSEIAQFRGNPTAWNYEWDGEQWSFSGDDVFYIPAAPAIAEPLSRALFSLIYGTQDGLYAEVIPHPSVQAHSLLAVRQTDVIPLAIAADPQPLADVLQITVDDGALLQAEADGIVAAVQAKAGQTVNLVDFIPASWQPYVMDKAGAIAAGYFPELAPAP